MSTYYTVLTNLGAALHANAQVMQTTVPWTHMCLGDGGGAPVVPVQTQTALKREVHRLPITDIAQHPDNPSWLIVEAVVPSDVGGWTVRETALYGGAAGAQCIAVGNYPETYKPVLAEGAAREMVMRMVVEISSTATVKLSIDPAVAIASHQWVEGLEANESEAKAGSKTGRWMSPLRVFQAIAAVVKQATENAYGWLKIATSEDMAAGESDEKAVTPKKLRAGFHLMLGANGCIAFPTWLGGLIIQWGGFGGAALNQGPINGFYYRDFDVTFPISFVEECYLVLAAPGNGGGVEGAASNISKSKTSARIYLHGTENATVQTGSFFALGK